MYAFQLNKYPLQNGYGVSAEQANQGLIRHQAVHCKWISKPEC